MHLYSLFYTFFFILIYNFNLSFAVCEAGHETVLVLGHSDHNLLKVAFVQERLVNDTNVEKAFSECGDASFLTFHSDKSGTLDKQLNHHLVQATFLNTQTCTVTIATKGTDEMSLEELETLQEMIYYVNSGLIVVEIGNKATQTTVILEHSTFCWGMTSLHIIDAPNYVLLCNDVKISETPLLNGAKIKTLFERDHDDQLASPTTTITWPSILPSAMATADSSENKKNIRSSKKTSQKSARELYYKKGRKIAINWNDDDQESQVVDIEHMRKSQRKLACKYRKSCYETGILPNLKAQKTVFTTEESSENAAVDVDDIEEDDTLALKVLCKYRPSCYAEIGMDLNEANHKKSKGVLITKKSAFLDTENRPKKKETIREIARKAVKEVEKKDREDPKAKISVIEKHLTETEEKLELKNRCKYRKSCYETGKLPQVESYHAPSWLSFEPVIDYASVYLAGNDDEEEKSFEEKNELQRKVFCKYRKSCYESGVAPKIEQTQKFHFEEVVERSPVEIPLQVRCKYRKSCYETGIIPDLKKPIVPVEAKPKPVPTTVEDLKVYCKYRKSCYREKALEVADLEKNEPNEEMESNERILVEEVTDDSEKIKPVINKAEKAVEVVTEVPKKAKKLTEKVVAAVVSDDSKETNRNKKSKGKHSAEDVEKAEPEEELHTKKIKKPKAPPPNESEIVVPKKSKSRKSAEVETVVEEEVPEHISAFSMDEPDEVTMEEVVDDQSPKKDLKFKKPKKKSSKQETSENEEKENIDAGEAVDTSSIGLKEKLQCKYRKSCYETHEPPQIINDPFSWHFKHNYLSFGSAPPTPEKEISEEKWNQMSEIERKVECKYRKSCYENRKLPPIVSASDGIWHNKHVFTNHKAHIDPSVTIEEWQEKPESQRKLACKYRKSCYDTSVLPEIHQTPRPQEPSEPQELSKGWVHKSEADQKLECKYRKSCYESGILPSLAPSTVETVIESIHDNPKETIQQRCKYRKSCYAAAAQLKNQKAAAEQQRTKSNVIDEETLVVKHAQKASHIRKEQKSTEKEEAADTSAEEKKSKKIDSKASKKQKPKPSSSKKSKEKDDDDSGEEEYKEIPPAEPKLNATELAKNLTTHVKVACKYRQSCYLSAAMNHMPPEEIMRMRGIKCSKYRISCREQLGLPPLIHPPVGPNGRKLCRKKKPENSLKI